ncbi:MAG: hypothetical protein ABSC06_15215 [Rhodopila sp.]|jgi:hypothetical protein
MKLIWHEDDLLEQDWLRYLFGDLIETEITDLDLRCFDDNCIHVVSSNRAPLVAYTRYFADCRAQCKRLILVHVSDEWFSGGYKLYEYFDLVIRWNHTYLADHPGIITVPLGYPNATGHSRKPADQRRYAWSFIGEIKSSRIAMAAAFKDFAPQFMLSTDSLSAPTGGSRRLSKVAFDRVLEETVFVPSPMGNATMDTCRVYEGLELGCIPILELRPSLDYYTNLFGPNPLPAFHNWSAARRFAEQMFKNPSALLRVQAEICNWWESYKAKICTQVREAISGPSHASDLQHYGAMLRNRIAVVHQPLRIAELLRHQTSSSLLRRLARPGRPLKRIMRDTIPILR